MKEIEEKHSDGQQLLIIRAVPYIVINVHSLLF